MSHINVVLLDFIKTKMNSSLEQVMLCGENLLLGHWDIFFLFYIKISLQVAVVLHSHIFF